MMTIEQGLAITSGVTAAAVAVGLFVWKLWYSQQKFVKVGEISKLFIYPVKSCRGIEVNSADATFLGLRNGPMKDRVFLVVTPDGTFVTARQEHSMLLITPNFKGSCLVLDAPEMNSLEIDPSSLIESKPPVIKCRVWGQEVDGYDCGKEATEWLQKFLKKDYRLVHFASPLQPKFAKKRAKYQQLFMKHDAAAYADLTPYLLMADPSVAEMNTRLDNNVNIRNFRPNIVVRGSQPYDEDNWKKIKIGTQAAFRNVKPCQRCLLTTIDPDTAIKTGEEPLKTLKSYRKTKDKFMKQFVGESALLGVGLCVDYEGEIKIGDPVYVTYA